jgi:hypothetical protein
MRGRFSTAFFLSLSLAGCVSSTMITNRTVGYNKVVEDSNNQVLLLNVVRARFRHPMYFTGLTLLRGSQSVQVGTGSSLPFGGEAPSIFTVNPNANLNINPSYDVAVLDTKEFMSGITTPVEMKTLKYYWDQGWSQQMLLFLFVRKIDLGSRCFLNVPWNAADEGCEAGVPKLNEYLDKKLDIVEDPAPRRTAVGPPITLPAGQTAPNVGDIVNAYVNKLTLAKEKGNVYQLYSEAKGFIFQYCPELRECDAGSRQHVAIASDSDNPDEKKPKIFIRSPEAVLFFLGELAREELEGRTPPQRLASGEPLFVVKRSATLPTGAALSVEYEGSWYYIPSGPEGGRSMHVLSLVNQILSLHKSRPELPSTSAVTVVGR